MKHVPPTSVLMVAVVPTAVAQERATGAGVRRAGVASFVMKVIFLTCLWGLMFYVLFFELYFAC